MREKRSLSLHGHRTSIALEPEFWSVLDRHIADSEQSMAAFLAELDDERVMSQSEYGLATFLRVWVVRQLLQK